MGSEMCIRDSLNSLEVIALEFESLFKSIPSLVEAPKFNVASSHEVKGARFIRENALGVTQFIQRFDNPLLIEEAARFPEVLPVCLLFRASKDLKVFLPLWNYFV